ncbi:unnamed protein product, partial [Vitis vinifera]|uniref:Uncharacterized protein n=1 Tax=Vitis vinifera TaxID=29760 RepID=D7TVM9_VITVI
MGRAPCCSKVGLQRGPWTADYIRAHGQGNWRFLPKKAFYHVFFPKFHAIIFFEFDVEVLLLWFHVLTFLRGICDAHDLTKGVSFEVGVMPMTLLKG